MGRVERKKTPGNKKNSNKFKSAEKTRKQLRKEKRQQKKISRAVYYQKKKSKNQSEKTNEKSTEDLRKINNIKTLRENEEEKNSNRKNTPVIIFKIFILICVLVHKN